MELIIILLMTTVFIVMTGLSIALIIGIDLLIYYLWSQYYEYYTKINSEGTKKSNIW